MTAPCISPLLASPCSPSPPSWPGSYCRLVEDLLDIGTLRDCQDVFSYMEQSVVGGGRP